MTDTTDKVAFAAAELNAASDALASAAADVDALRAELARQTGIAVDHCARADAAEQMVCVDALAAERDAAIAARDEAVTGLDVYEQRIREIADDVFGVQDAHAASVVLLDAVGRQCHRERIERAAAERARDEVGIQLAAAQAEIARMRRVVDEARTLMATPAGERLPAERAVCDALRALDAVPGDALASRINAALEASGIDTDNTPKAKPRAEVVQWEKRAEKAWSERDAALSTMLTLRAEVARLTAEVEAMRAVVEEADRVYTTCEPNAPMLVQHLGECLDALRARKVGG